MTVLEYLFRWNSFFYRFIIGHQRSIIVCVLITLLVSTWYVFYGMRGRKGNNTILISLYILSILTIYGGWKVYNEYHQLPLYLLYVVIPYSVVAFTSGIITRLRVATTIVRPILLVAYFISATWYSFYMLSLLTPVFAIVCY